MLLKYHQYGMVMIGKRKALLDVLVCHIVAQGHYRSGINSVKMKMMKFNKMEGNEWTSSVR
jgi:hypothetical protein